LKDLSFRERER
jgi:hypothetical protein